MASPEKSEGLEKKAKDKEKEKEKEKDDKVRDGREGLKDKDEDSDQEYYSSVMSSATSGAVVAARTGKQLEQKSQSELYNVYNEIFVKYESEPLKVHEVLRKSAEESVKAIRQSSLNPGEIPPEGEDYVIKFDGKTYNFPSDKTFVTIGRWPNCDIPLSKMVDQTVSRVHLVLYISRASGEIAIVDPNGTFGYRVKSQVEANLQDSKHKERKLVQFMKWEASAILQLGSKCVTLNPKLCVVCQDVTRGVKFDCGHYITCTECSQQLKDCPTCRAAIKEKIPHEGLTTHCSKP